MNINKEYKLEESEALDMLNDNLRDQVITFMNGNLLNKTGIFQVFNVLFLSQITFKLKSHTFSIDDAIFEEGTVGTKLYYISKGSSVIIHKETHTFIHEMSIDDCFGELSFFSGELRRCTVRSKKFTEVLYISKDDFTMIAELNEEWLKIIEMIKSKIKKHKNLSAIGIKWYLWEKEGHISIDCKQFKNIIGNIQK